MNNEQSDKVQEVFTLLKNVMDPELMINIVDLGLVYDVRIAAEQKFIEIDMTLTSQGCPLGDVIIENVEHILKEEIPEVQVKVNIVWEPFWTPDRLTDEGKSALGRI